MKVKDFFWTIPFFCFIAGYVLLRHLSHIDQLEAPAIVGTQLQYAVTELSSKNLNLRLIAQKEDSDLPHGTVLSQTPIAGQQVKPHQAIHVVLSKKPDKQTAPNVINKFDTVIQKELEHLGVRNKTYFLPSNKPHNSCIAQFPAPGSPLDENKIITYLSAGSNKSVLFPKLKGRPVPEVVEFLEKHGIKTEVLHSSRTPLGHQCDHTCTITDQRPLTGSIVHLNTQKPLLVQLQAK